MKKLLLTSLTIIGSFAAQAAPAANVDKSGVIIQGYDVVAYFKAQKAEKGDAKFQTQYNGATYLFANDADKSEFLKEPKKYEPQFGGWCAFAVAVSKSKVDVDPKSFVIQDGRLLLFYNGIWANTREKWLHTKSKDPKEFLKQADANWPQVESKEP